MRNCSVDWWRLNLVNTMRVPSKDIGMEFGLKKCDILQSFKARKGCLIGGYCAGRRK